MKTRILSTGKLAAVIGVILLSNTAVWALTPPDFTGVFSGFYAPSAWTTTISGNTAYSAPPVVESAGAPNAVELIGAVGTGSVPQQPSIIDYSIVLPGSAPVSVSFTYAFFSATGPSSFAQAQVLDNGVTVATLTSSGSQFRLPNLFNGGDTLDLRLLSPVVNIPDILEIAPIPEPSTLALAGVSTAAFLVQLFRCRSAKR
jgi:hypothetical protein